MPEGSGPTYRLGRGAVRLGPDGSVESVVARSGSASYLAGGGRVRAWLGGDEVRWPAPVVVADVDEVELRFDSRAGLGVVVRHSFADGWSIRIAFDNQSAERLTAAELTWVPAADRPAWALAAGATGAYAIPGPAGDGPLLGGELELGGCDAVTERGLGLGRLDLAPQERRVVQWRWDWFADPRSFHRRRFAAVPRHLVLPEGEAATIAADDDQAVEAYGLELERRGGQLELVAPGVLATTVSVSSRRGVTTYPLTWVTPLDEVLAEIADPLLDGPRTPAGIVALPDVDAALVVQYGLAQARVADPAAADDALSLFVSRLPDEAVRDGRGVSLLVGEFSRTGDEDALVRATEALLRQPGPAPGLGIAAAAVALARLALGRPVGAVLDQVARPASPAQTDRETAVALELRLTTARSAPGDRTDETAVRRLGSALGAGLRGSPVRPLPLDAQAYYAAVLGLLPEGLGARTRPEWGVAPHDVARTAEAQVLARLGARDSSAARAPHAAYSWLILGRRVA